MTSTDASLITCQQHTPTNKTPLPIPPDRIYTGLAPPSYSLKTNRLAPSSLSDYSVASSSSSSILPPLLSPSVLIPLRDCQPTPTPPSPASPVSDSSNDHATGSSRRQTEKHTDNHYQQALERLEQANLQDEQMLSSFKRESSLSFPFCIALPRPP